MEKFKGKYRIPSARLQNWDYGWNAIYFITIRTQNGEYFFGDVENGKTILSEIGKMAEKYWFEIPEHFPFVKLDAFVVMPNHIHGIIEIAKTDDDIENATVAVTGNGNATGNGNGNATENGNATATVETQNFASLPTEQTQPPQPTQPSSVPPSKNQFGPQSKNLASIVRGYKIGVTKNAKKINANFAWQPRYYDHIVRDDKSLQNIRNYIINNPKNWKGDKFNII